MTHVWDLCVVGGGMAGGLLAAALKDSGLSVLLLDAAPAPEAPRGLLRPRVSALTEVSQRMLVRTGGWRAMDPARVLPYREMQVWDGDGTGEVFFRADEVGAEALGWMVENDAVVHGLHQAVQGHGAVQWRVSTPVTRVERTDEGWRVTPEDGGTITARLLVGADGAQSRVRDWLGLAASPRPTGHHAVVGTIRSQQSHGARARQRFLDTGPLALLPMGGDGRDLSIVWSTSPGQAEALMALEPAAFDQALTRASQSCLGALSIQGPRGCFPIIERHAGAYVAERAALVGDAAHVVHPLAGQGINLGMLDVAVLVEELLNARERGLAPEHGSVLARYERRRRGHNLLMQQSFHGLQQLFAQSGLGWRWLRNTGLNLVNGSGPARRFFIEQALGRRRDLPALARP